MFSLIEKKLSTVAISSPQPTMDIEAGSLGAGDESSPFAFSPEQLGTLHNPKNLAAFSRFGGVEGLLEGLRSDQITGLSVKSEEPMDGFRTSITRRRTVIDEDPRHTGLWAQRRAIYLDNHLPTKKQPSFLHLLWLAYNDPVLFLLTAAAAVSLAIGLYQTFTTTHTANNPAVEWVEGVTIIVAVIIIVLAASINDWNKLKQFQRLDEKQLERDAKVVRCGMSRLISGSDILVGDIVHLEPGDIIPADGILIKGYNVMCDESTATGESELVHKTPGDDVFHAINECDDELRSSLAPMPDPFMLSGTKVLEGVGTFLVTATGVNSTYGKILASLKDDSEPTPLQVRLSVLAKNIARIGVVLALLLFVALFIRFLTSLSHGHSSPAEKGKNFINILIIALTVLVIAVPEGLPLAVTLSLAYATTRMLKDHNLVRQLKACEIMGNATNICSDKTGTLTQNKMAVVAGMVGPNFGFHDSVTQLPSAGVSGGTEILSTTEFMDGLSLDIRKIIRQSIALNTTAFEDKEGSSFVGSNTESALLNFARDHLDMGRVAEERSEQSIVQFIPFSASRQCTAAVIKLRGSPGVYRVFVKGASEVLLSKCTRIVQDPMLASLDIELTSQDRQRVVETINTYASQALRTISLVYRDLHLPSQVNGAKSEPQVNFSMEYLLQNLVFQGVIGIHDPLRPGVPESVQTCQRAGVTVRMVTGDNLLTAKAIAQQCGILSGDASDVIMEGAKFWALSNSEMGEVIPHLKVLARSSPEDKRKLVVWLKEMGEIVAVTGDGTNDASAMSAADVSFSMGGVGGTEVAREASSIILLTDDFTSIVKAIKWGRAVNDSVKKFLQFQIIITVTSVLLAFVSSISNSEEQSVLTPVQLMWINLFQDTLAALALATDRPQPRVLDRKPEPRTAPLITMTMWKTIAGQSIYQIAVTFVLYFAGPRMFAYHTEHQIRQVETMVFNTYVWMQIFNMYNSRQYDNTFNIFEGVLSNWLFIAVSTTMIGAQILIIFVGGQAFSVVPLTGVQWAVSFVLGLLSLAVGALIRCTPDLALQRVVDKLKRRRAAAIFSCMKG